MAFRPALAGLLLAAALPAHAEVRLQVTASACAAIPPADYVEPPGVEYQPGIDATGHPVARADIGQPAAALPDRFAIPISDYLYGRLAGATTTTSGVLQPQAVVGVVTYDHGQVLFNGQPLTADGQQALSAICSQAETK